MELKKKIVMVGPVFPYKGGISHYTGLMSKALASKYELKVVSFLRQYPEFLYPGKGQKDFDNDHFKIDFTEYLIDTINPLSWIKTSLAIKKFSPDLVIFQWWHPYFFACFSFIANLVRKITKCRLLFLCHNVLPHERLPFDTMMIKAAIKSGDFYIVHSEEDKANLLKLVPDAKVVRTVHPTYNAFKFENLTKEQARGRIGLDSSKVILFFGFIREYKGLKYLIKALPSVLKVLPELKLLIVGDFFDDKNSHLELIHQLGLNDSINIFDGYIPDKEVGKYFSAADLVVLPYLSATQSGIVQIAYGFEKPVIATDVGGLSEVVLNGETGYVVESASPEALAESIIRFYREDRAEEFTKNIVKEQEKYSWDRMVEIIEGFLKSFGDRDKWGE